jgi:hypothetical protein
MPVTVGPGVPTCLGVIDASPYAQGCILVRWYEACPDAGVPIWRYEFHVKRAVSGPLTPGDLAAGTYFARAVGAEVINGCIPQSPSLGSPQLPGILQAAIAFESPGDITPPVVAGDENMHLFTSQQYYVAVRAIALDAANVVYEDQNEEQVLSYSTGYQGEVWQHILTWPCLELCDDPPTIPVSVVGLPGITIAGVDDSIPVSVPPLDIQVRATDVVQDLARVLTEAIKEAVRGMKE